MQLPSPLLDGFLLERENRYRARVATALGEVLAFVPNPGRTLELLYPGARVVLAPAAPRPGPPRRTAFDLRLAYTREGRLVSVDTRLASPLFAEALTQGRVEPLAGYAVDRAEVVYGESRLDFRLTAPSQPVCLVEVKSSTLVEDGLARWPDSPSLRGQRHVRELAWAAAEGYRAAVVWIVQRPDATRLMPHAGIDPAFAAALRQVVGQGVEAYAYTCDVTRETVEVAQEIPVELPLL
ncbi:MAG: DNA/RNA nuclease SfsA [Anaerolineae bacterium]|nr:DNA/RNA nuclease SfsA [Anaerolineae bacterium]